MSFAGFRACLIYICLTVYEFSFILLIHHIILLILISVLSVTFWTYYKIYFFYHVLFDMKVLNYSFCDMFGSVLECYELTHISWLSTPGNYAWLNRHCSPIGCVIKSTHQGICNCSPIVNFLKFTFHIIKYVYHSRYTWPNTWSMLIFYSIVVSLSSESLETKYRKNSIKMQMFI